MPGAVVESVVAGTELERVLPKVTTVFESDDTFFGNIKKRDVEVVSYREMRAPMELRPGGRFSYFNPDGGDLFSPRHHLVRSCRRRDRRGRTPGARTS